MDSKTIGVGVLCGLCVCFIVSTRKKASVLYNHTIGAVIITYTILIVLVDYTPKPCSNY